MGWLYVGVLRASGFKGCYIIDHIIYMDSVHSRTCCGNLVYHTKQPIVTVNLQTPENSIQ